MHTLHTPLCSLEPQVVAHANEMFAVLSDPAIYEFEGEPPPSIERLAEGYRRKESRLSPDGTERWLNWVVRLPNGHLAGYVQATVLHTGASYIAHFSDRGRLFQADRGRQIGAAVDALGRHASPGLNVAQSSTISLKRPPGWAVMAAVLV